MLSQDEAKLRTRDFSELPPEWLKELGSELAQPYFSELLRFVADERSQHEVYPPPHELYSAFHYSSFENTRVLLLGQDPYHDVAQAHGLCFSVKPGVKPPPSLLNMFKELKADLGCRPPSHGYLVDWARQGILMLNAVLTVRAHSPNSHKDRGWEKFTDAVILSLVHRPRPCIFVLWGGYARKKAKLITAEMRRMSQAPQHTILEAAHPSPLSAKLFLGSRPFSAIDAALEARGYPPLTWQLEELA